MWFYQVSVDMYAVYLRTTDGIRLFIGVFSLNDAMQAGYNGHIMPTGKG